MFNIKKIFKYLRLYTIICVLIYFGYFFIIEIIIKIEFILKKNLFLNYKFLKFFLFNLIFDSHFTQEFILLQYYC